MLHCDSCKVQKPYATEIDKYRDQISPAHLIFSVTGSFFFFSLMIVVLLFTCLKVFQLLGCQFGILHKKLYSLKAVFSEAFGKWPGKIVCMPVCTSKIPNCVC